GQQRDSRSALFEGYNGGNKARRPSPGIGGSGGGYGYGYNGGPAASAYHSNSSYGYSGGPAASAYPGSSTPGAYRSATPNSRGQYSDATLNELESQNDSHITGILGKVQTLKTMTVAIGDEIRDSSALAEKMNNSFDSTRLRLRGTMNRMLLMAERTGVGWKVWLLFFAAVIFIFMYVWLF
ncbi:hypothetical protein Golomagni_07488, partial [Golovinomyces magnicellulatus]